jgi:hypothetical protein
MDFPVSEITYGFSLVENLIRASSGKRTLPLFPTLREEAFKGYDVKTRVAGETHYYQFKTPKVMIRRNAIECSNPSNLATPFLRMPIMRRPHSNQHNLLVALKAKRRNVFYTCPRLYDLKSFRSCYENGQIHVQSAYIDPAQIGKITDHAQHSIAFEPKASFGWYRSEPIRVEFLSAASAIPSFDDIPHSVTSLEQRVEEELELLADLLNQDGAYDLFSANPAYLRSLEGFARFIYLCRHFFDVQPMILVLQSSTD